MMREEIRLMNLIKKDYFDEYKQKLLHDKKELSKKHHNESSQKCLNYSPTQARDSKGRWTKMGIIDIVCSKIDVRDRDYIKDKLKTVPEEVVRAISEEKLPSLSKESLEKTYNRRYNMYADKSQFELANIWLRSITGSGGDIYQKAKDIGFDPTKEITLSKQKMGKNEILGFRVQDSEFQNIQTSRWGDIPNTYENGGANQYTTKMNRDNVLLHPEVLYSPQYNDKHMLDTSEREYVLDSAKVREKRGIHANSTTQYNGGKGSGNHGHAGILGHRGGSSKKKASKIGTKPNESLKWGGDKPFGSAHFQKSVEDTAKEIENEYGVSLGNSRMVRENVMANLRGTPLNGASGMTSMKGSSEIYISIADRIVNDSPEATFDPEYHKKFMLSTSLTANSNKGLLRHEFGHAMIGELAKYYVENSSQYKKFEGEGRGYMKDEKINEAYQKINEALYEVGRKEAEKLGQNAKLSTRTSKDASKYSAMSEYGLTSEAEFVAESISNPNYSEVTKKVSDAVKNLVKNLGSKEPTSIHFIEDFVNEAEKEKVFDLCSGYPIVKFDDNVVNRLGYKFDNIVSMLNGGKGSGNHGHSGRPGKRGGSAKYKVSQTEFENIILKNEVDSKSGQRNEAMTALCKKNGYDAKPELLSENEFNERIEKDGLKVLYRGINDSPRAQEHIKDFKEGELWCGSGYHGSGTYTTDYDKGASSYAGGNPNNIITMALKKGAKVLNVTNKNEYVALQNEISNLTNVVYGRKAVEASRKGDDKAAERYSELQAKMARMDEGVFAAYKGYDAIEIPAATGSLVDESFVVVLNRGALIVKR